MQRFGRYAVFYTPPPGPFALAGARWLGWDLAEGQAVTQPDCGVALGPITDRPRRYGFHATLKPPFALAEGCDPADLATRLSDLAAMQAPVIVPDLTLARIGRFLALVPGAASEVDALAAVLVTGLDPCRAPLTPEARARRRPERLTEGQRALLDRYGYPFVLDQFRFHMTLTGPLDPAMRAPVQEAAQHHFAPVLGRALRIDDVTLCGEDDAGRFHAVARFPLGVGRP